MTKMQKILNKVLPSYLASKDRLMCWTMIEAGLAGEITWEEYKFATKEIKEYLLHFGSYDTLFVSLSMANLNPSMEDRERIYQNWSNRPITSPTLEQKWITQALSYGEGIWEGLKIAEDVGDLTCTQVDIIKYSIEQFGREPTIQELKDWTAVQQQN